MLGRIFVIVAVFCEIVLGNFSGGDGSIENPYLIENGSQLSKIMEIPYKSYKLIKDIDFSKTEFAKDSGWIPLGTKRRPFTGSLDGNGFVIRNLYIRNRLDPNDYDNMKPTALFGYANHALFKNLYFKDFNIDGTWNCAVLCSVINDSCKVINCGIESNNKENKVGDIIYVSANSEITNCYCDVSLHYNNNYTGIVLYAENSVVKNSFNVSNFSLNEAKGGIIGEGSNNRLENCYSLYSPITTVRNIKDKKDIVMKNCYYSLDNESENENKKKLGDFVPLKNMLDISTYKSWDFKNIWEMKTNSSLPGFKNLKHGPVIVINEKNRKKLRVGSKYVDTLEAIPVKNSISNIEFRLLDNNEGVALSKNGILSFIPSKKNKNIKINYCVIVNNKDTINKVYSKKIVKFKGSGTKADPFQIYRVKELFDIRRFPKKNYKLMNDLDFAKSEYSDGKNWVSIGEKFKFSGVFDGNGHVIKNFKFNQFGLSFDDLKKNKRFKDVKKCSIFGNVENGVIKNLGLVNYDIFAVFSSAPLANSVSNSRIENCFAIGSIVSKYKSSGLITSFDKKSLVKGCLVSTNILNSDYAAGIVLFGQGKVEKSFVKIVHNSNRGGGVVRRDYIDKRNGINDDLRINKTVGEYINVYTGLNKLELYDSNNVKNLLGIKKYNWKDVYKKFHIAFNTDATISYNIGLKKGVKDSCAINTKIRKQIKSFKKIKGNKNIFVSTKGYVSISDSIKKGEYYLSVLALLRDGTKKRIQFLVRVSDFKGFGDKMSPYYIETIDDLDRIRNDMEKCYVLKHDLDFKGTKYMEGNGWSPIGKKSRDGFSGVFDGNGYVIKNLYINDNTLDNAGLFSRSGRYDGSFKNLGIVNFYIKADENIGAIVGSLQGGYNSGVAKSNIVNCYAIGKIDGNTKIGGIVGTANTNSLVENCYSNVKINGKKDVGGISGHLGGLIKNCYSISDIMAYENFGVIFGMDDVWRFKINTYIKNSYGILFNKLKSRIDFFIYDSNSVKSFDNINSIKVSEFKNFHGVDSWEFVKHINFPKIKNVNNYPFLIHRYYSFKKGEKKKYQIVFKSWDKGKLSFKKISGNSGIRISKSGLLSVSSKMNVGYYPIKIRVRDINLREFEQSVIVTFSDFKGAGTSESPFLISNYKELINMKKFPKAVFCLSNNIDASVSRKNIKGAEPIFSKKNPFFGVLDGAGYSINGLYINRVDENNIGLIGCIKSGKLRRLNLKDCDISGKDSVGGIAGVVLDGIVDSCSVFGKVNGRDNVGGVVGYVRGMLKNSFSVAKIKGRNNVGGVVGINSYSRRASFNIFSNSIIDGENNVGGVVGNGNVYSCYSNSIITGNDMVGGISGSSRNSFSCYSTSIINANVNAAGIVSNALSGSGGMQTYFSGKVFGKNSHPLISTSVRSEPLNMYSSYWNAEKNLSKLNGSCFPLSPSDMKRKGSFEGWNFDTVWVINDGQSYPKLRGIYNLLQVNIPTLNKLSSSKLDIDLSAYIKGINVENISILLGPKNIVLDKNNRLKLDKLDSSFTVVFDIQSKNGFHYYTSLDVNVFDKFPVYDIKNGNGTFANPFVIKSAKDLSVAYKYPNSAFRLENDIDCNNYDFGKNGFIPIGDSKKSFSGFFDGKNHVIKNLKINSKNKSYVGLFGYLHNSIVKNLRLEDADISGGGFCGGIAGYSNNSKVYQCYVSGKVSGADYVGGILGYNINSEIYECYSAGNVNGTKYVGGILGLCKYSDIEATYSTATVKGSGFVGGLVGIFYDNIGNSSSNYFNGVVLSDNNWGFLDGNRVKYGIRWSYYNTSKSFEKIYDLNIALSDSALMNPSKFKYWRFSTSKFWDIDSLKSYPKLKNIYDKPIIRGITDSIAFGKQKFTTKVLFFINDAKLVTFSLEDSPKGMEIDNKGNISCKVMPKNKNLSFVVVLTDENGFKSRAAFSVLVSKLKGRGIEGDPFLIKSYDDIEQLNRFKDGVFKIVHDIDFKNKNFEPIGVLNDEFRGKIYGNGCTIKNLKISNKKGKNCAFIAFAKDALVDSLNFVDVDIVGKSNVATIIASSIRSTVKNCNVTGKIKGVDCVSSVVANNEETSVLFGINSQCIVLGEKNVGGIVGVNRGVLDSCFFIGDVKGKATVGGLVGEYIGKEQRHWHKKKLNGIKNSFSSGSVKGVVNVGGFVGECNLYFRISSSYSNSDVLGKINVGGFVGSTNAFMGLITNCYNSGYVSGQKNVGCFGGKYTKQQNQNGGCVVSIYYNGVTNSYSLSKISSNGKNNFIGSIGNGYEEVEKGTHKGRPNSYPFMSSSNFRGNFIVGEEFENQFLNGGFVKSNDSLMNSDFYIKKGWKFGVGFKNNNYDYHSRSKTRIAKKWAINDNNSYPRLVKIYNSPIIKGLKRIDNKKTFQYRVLAVAMDAPIKKYYIKNNLSGIKINRKGILSIKKHKKGFNQTICVGVIDENGYKTEYPVFLNINSREGNGSIEKPYVIRTARQLQNMNSELDAAYILGNDIDFKNTEFDSANGLGIFSEFKPIGNFQTPFTGSLDGNGYKIKNLRINDEKHSDIGLFGDIRLALIENLTLLDVHFLGTKNSGAIAGKAVLSVIRNCRVKGLVLGNKNVGGIVGVADSTVVKNSEFLGKCTNMQSRRAFVGGIAGRLSNSSLYRSYSVLESMSGYIVGGLVGQIYNSSIKASYSNGNIGTIYSKTTGGLVGNSNKLNIKDCYFGGVLLSNFYADCFVGNMKNTTIENSFGILSMPEKSRRQKKIGKKVLKSNIIKNSFVVSNTVFDSSYSYIKIEQLKNDSLFINWDLDSVWQKKKNSIPMLRFMKNYPIVYGLSKNSSYYIASNINVKYELMGSKKLYFKLIKSPDWVKIDSMTGEISIIKNKKNNRDQKIYLTVKINDEKIDTNPLLTNSLFTNYLFTNLNITKITGNGTENSPYVIDSYDALKEINNHPKSYFKLVKDIDASRSFLSDVGFSPSKSNEKFSGVLDGNGFVIKNLYVNRYNHYRSSHAFGGLFSTLNGAVIKNLGIESCIIKGYRGAGAFAGAAINSKIENCYATGIMRSIDGFIGGLFGGAKNCEIKNCYAETKNIGSNEMSELVGQMVNTRILTSYFRGEIYHYGRVFHFFEDDTLQPVYTLNSNLEIEGEKIRKNDKISSMLSGNKLDLIKIWKSNGQNKMPTLRAFEKTSILPKTIKKIIKLNEKIIINPIKNRDNSRYKFYIKEMPTSDTVSFFHLKETGTIDFLANKTGAYRSQLIMEDLDGTKNYCNIEILVHNYKGMGTRDNPFEIYTENELFDAYKFSDCSFILKNDINAIDSKKLIYDKRTRSKISSYRPIGTKLYPFTGVFDGNGYVIRNLYIKSRWMKNVGLIGIMRGAEVKNLSIINSSYNGDDFVGGIAGSAMSSVIENCRYQGDIEGEKYVGGIAGALTFSKIIRSSSEIKIVGGAVIGGIVGGLFWDSEISETMASGSVSIGYDRKRFTRSFNASSYEAYIGGLFGYGLLSSIENSYFSGYVTDGNIAGFTENMIIKNCYVNSKFNKKNINSVDNLFLHSRLINSFCRIDDTTGKIIQKYSFLKSANQLQNKAIYKKWNFKKIWEMSAKENNGLPTLRRLKLNGKF